MITKNIFLDKKWVLPLIIILMMLLGLWLRLLSMPLVLDSETPKLLFMDSWYNMRQIEQIVANFPAYAWYDPMANYPFGKIVGWGPLFPMMCSVACILTGSLTRPDIMITASWIPPILGICMIPVLFYLGRLLSGNKTGLFAAFIITILSGECMYRSFFGYVDHQVTEVLFSSLFVLAYIALLQICYKNPVTSLTFSGIKHFIVPSLLTGFLYFLGIMNSTTNILFALLIVFFTLVWMIISHFIHQDRMDIVIINTIIFGLFSLLYLIFGVNQAGFSLHYYTAAHIFVGLAIIAGTVILYLISFGLRKRPFFMYAGVLVGLSIVGSLLFAVLFPGLFNQVQASALDFFLYSYTDSHINEMEMWGLERAFTSFNITLFLFLGGVLVLLRRIFQSASPHHLFIIIWSLLIVISTVMHVRYEYYAAVPIALLSGFFLTWIIGFPNSSKYPQKKKISFFNTPMSVKIRYGIVILALLVITVLSVQTTVKVAEQDLSVITINDDWMDTLSWFEANSPDPGVDYTTIYNEETFVYPKNSYGVLSWWDYGHWIMFLSKRIPITNPFQKSADHVATFFTRTSEPDAEFYADLYGGRYIITDYRTATDVFSGVVQWASLNQQNEDYQKILYLEKSPGVFQPIIHLRQPFYESMLIRLHFFDGSYTFGQGGLYVESKGMTTQYDEIPVITKSVNIGSDAVTALKEKMSNPDTREPGEIYSIIYPHPIEDVSALTHYRLIYESPTSPESSGKSWDVKEVKIFEHVDGYIIPGEGIIELPLITNQGREFMYVQKSTNSTFVVPYSTQNNPYDVKSTGPYRIRETGEMFEVNEQDIHPISKIL